MTARCLRCHAGNEWIEGAPTIIAESDEITRLRSELAAARAERERFMGALNETLDGLVFIQAHLAKVPNHDLLDKCSRLVMNVKTVLEIDKIDDRLTFPNGTARHLDNGDT